MRYSSTATLSNVEGQADIGAKPGTKRAPAITGNRPPVRAKPLDVT